MKKTIFFMLGCVAVPALAAEVSFSEPEVALGNAVQLIFTADKSIQTPPDLTTIQEHFVVSGTQNRMQSSFVNGRGTQSYELIYTLFPKKVGSVELKGLTVNGETLAPVSVTVVAQGANSTVQSTTGTGVPAPMLQLTAAVSTPKIYQGESFVYTMRLAETAGVADGSFQTPEIVGARVQALGQPKMGTTTMDGKPARLAEQAFLITPERAGTLTIPPTGFRGQVPDKTARRRANVFPEFFDNDILFGALRPMRQIYLQTEPVTVVVETQPSDWQGWWLPSTEVIVSEQYSLPETLNVGMPFERKIVLSARGVDGNALPLISMKASGSLTVYPSPEKRGTQLVNSGLLGTEEITFALVPTVAGQITVPEIRIPWFDTVTKEKRVATLPAKTITVSSSDGQGAVVPTTPKQPIETIPTVESTPLPVPSLSTVTPDSAVPVGEIRPVSMALLFAGGVLAGLLGALAVMFVVFKRKNGRTLGSFEPVETKRKKKKPLPDLYPFE